MDRLRFSYPHDMCLPKNDNIRMITIPITWAYDGPKDTVENPKWICACPEDIAQMSGTAYFFANILLPSLEFPLEL